MRCTADMKGRRRVEFVRRMVCALVAGIITLAGSTAVAQVDQRKVAALEAKLGFMRAKWETDPCEVSAEILSAGPDGMSGHDLEILARARRPVDDLDAFEKGAFGAADARAASFMFGEISLEHRIEIGARAIERLEAFGREVSHCPADDMIQSLTTRLAPIYAAAFLRGLLSERDDRVLNHWTTLAEFQFLDDRPADALATLERLTREDTVAAYSASGRVACKHEHIAVGRDYVKKCLKGTGDELEMQRHCLEAMAACVEANRTGARELLDRLARWHRKMIDEHRSAEKTVQDVLSMVDFIGEVGPHIDKVMQLSQSYSGSYVGSWQRAQWLHRAGRFEQAWAELQDHEQSRADRIIWSNVVWFFGNALDFEHAWEVQKRLPDTMNRRTNDEKLRFELRLLLMQSKLEQAIQRVRSSLAADEAPQEVAEVIDVFVHHGYPGAAYELEGLFGLARNEPGDMRLQPREARQAALDWDAFRSMLAAVTDDAECSVDDPRAGHPDPCLGLSISDVEDHRARLHDRGILKLALEHVDWTYAWQPDPQSSDRRYSLREAESPVFLLLEHGLFAEIDELVEVTRQEPRLKEVVKPHHRILRLLVDDADKDVLEDAFLEAVPDDASSWSPSHIELAMGLWGRQDVVHRAYARNDLPWKQERRAWTVRAARIVRAGGEGEIERLFDAAADSDSTHAKLATLQAVAATGSAQRALEFFEQLDMQSAYRNRHIPPLVLSLRMMAGELSDIDMSSLPADDRRALKAELEARNCYWPWTPTGGYAPDPARSPTGSGWSCAEPGSPSSAVDAREEVRLLDLAFQPFDRPPNVRDRLEGELRSAVRATSARQARVAAARLRGVGGGGALRGRTLYPNAHPRVVEAINEPVLKAAPGARGIELSLILSRLSREPSAESRQALVDFLARVDQQPVVVRDVVRRLAERELWVEIARVVAPEIELGEQWAVTLRQVVGAYAKIGDSTRALDAARVYAERASTPFDALLDGARLLERNGLSEPAVALAQRAQELEPGAPAPRALLARHGIGESPKGWQMPWEHQLDLLALAIRQGAGGDEVLDRSFDSVRHGMLAGHREALWRVVDVFRDNGRAELAVEFLDARVPWIIEYAPLRFEWGERLARLLGEAREHDRALEVARRTLGRRSRLFERSASRLLSRLAFYLGDGRRALRWARHSVERQSHPRAVYNLAQAQALVGCRKSASETFERALVTHRRYGREALSDIEEAHALRWLRRYPADASRTMPTTCTLDGR